MDTLERWLRSRPLVISCLLAAIVAYAISADGILSEDAMPFGDGEHYVMRCMTLYGFLHSGHWSQFWNVFTLPKQSLAPLHYWIFFLLPQGWASFTAYGVIQVVTTYGLMVLGAWQLCRTLDREEWTPAFFLLCAAQNISIDYSYFYFADVPFMSLGMLVLAWQMRAWREPGWRWSLLSGAGAGLLFWVKPPNALIFAATYFIAELARLILLRFSADERAHGKKLLTHGAAVLIGFAAVTFSALACGGFQSIIRLIDVNEVSDIFATKLQCTGLLRFFYFPLCLTYFYHATAILLIFSLAGIAAHQLNKSKAVTPWDPKLRSPFPASLLLPLVIAYAVLGEFFSFGEASKGMRSLLLVLPVLWLVIFWGLERCRMKPAVLFLAAAAYVLCAFAQVFSDAFGTVDLPTESYQLKGDWMGRLPQPHFLGTTRIDLTNIVIDEIRKTLPEGGKIAVGSEQIFLTSESLAWTEQYERALRGEPPIYEFENFLTNDGKFCRSALVNAQGVLIYVHADLQYSRDVLKASNDLMQFCLQTWFPDGTAQMIPLQSERVGIWGCYIVFKKPLSDGQVTQIINGTKARELSPTVEFNPPVEHRLSWQECWDVLEHWKQKRFGG